MTGVLSAVPMPEHAEICWCVLTRCGTSFPVPAQVGRICLTDQAESGELVFAIVHLLVVGAGMAGLRELPDLLWCSRDLRAASG